jgi:hypothetical protein
MSQYEKIFGGRRFNAISGEIWPGRRVSMPVIGSPFIMPRGSPLRGSAPFWTNGKWIIGPCVKNRPTAAATLTCTGRHSNAAPIAVPAICPKSSASTASAA